MDGRERDEEEGGGLSLEEGGREKKWSEVEEERRKTIFFQLAHTSPFFFLSGLALPASARPPFKRKPLPLPAATMRARTLARAAALALLSAVLSLSPRNLAAAEQVTSLDKGPWTLSNGQGVSLPVSLPKYALEAMQDAGLVGDPLWR